MASLFFPNFASILPSPEAAVNPPPPDNTLPFAIGSFLKNATKAVNEWRDAEDHKQELTELSDYFEAKGLTDVSGLLRKRAASFRPNFFGDPDQVSKSRGSILKAFLELGKEELDADTATKLKQMEVDKYANLHADDDAKIQSREDIAQMNSIRTANAAALNSMDQDIVNRRRLAREAAIKGEADPTEEAAIKELERQRDELRGSLREQSILKTSSPRQSSIINTRFQEPDIPSEAGSPDPNVLMDVNAPQIPIEEDTYEGAAVAPAASSDVPRIRIPLRDSTAPSIAVPEASGIPAQPAVPVQTTNQRIAAGFNKKIETIKLPTKELIKIGTNVATDPADKNTLTRLEAQLDVARTPQEITAIGRTAALINKKYAPTRGATYEFTPVIQTTFKDSSDPVWIVSRKNEKTGTIEYGISYTGEDISKLDIAVLADITNMSQSEIIAAAANVRKAKAVTNPQLTEPGSLNPTGIFLTEEQRKRAETTTKLEPYRTRYSK